MTRRPTVIRRPLPPRSLLLDTRANRAGTEAVERALFPLAAEVRAELRGRWRWPVEMLPAEIRGAI